MKVWFLVCVAGVLGSAVMASSRSEPANKNKYLAGMLIEEESCVKLKEAVDLLKREYIVGPEFSAIPSRHVSVRKACIVAFNAEKGMAAYVNEQLPSKLTELGISDFDELSVEQEVVMQALAPANWALDRIDGELDGKDFDYPFTGKGVDIYILDTGFLTTHDEFGSRAKVTVDFTGEGRTDEIGHGTHCAGIAGGTKYGVAKNANLIGVKVLGQREGTTSTVIDGVKYAIEQGKSANKPVVISMSLGGALSPNLDKFVKEAAIDNIVVVAAGNDSMDACNFSPASLGGKAREGGVITVGATNRSDTRAFFSNYGKCVDIWAPGLGILSAWKGGNDSSRVKSGTSMATPLVAGVAAVLLEKHNMDKAAAQEELLTSALDDVVEDAGPYSTRKLLNLPRLQGLPTSAPVPAPVVLPPTPTSPDGDSDFDKMNLALDSWCHGASHMYWPDLNGDGHADAVCFDYREGRPFIRMNDGQGGWLPEGMYPSGWCSTVDGVKRIVRFADFDGDGRDDMICDTQLGDHEVRISHSTVTGGRWSYSEQGVVLDNWCFDASEMFWPDLNGDGHADAVCFVRTQGLPYIKMNDGRGGWLPEGMYPSGWCSTNDGVDRRVSFADLNGDGLDDMICDSRWKHSARISLPTQTGSGVWMYRDVPLAALDYWCHDATQMYWTDLNGDGLADAVCFYHNVDLRYIRINDGRGGWQREQVYPSGWCFPEDELGMTREVRFADMNGDGLDDMVCDALEGWHQVRISSATATGGRWSFANVGLILSNFCQDASHMYWPDLNGDGHADAVCFDYREGRPFIRMNDGQGGWLPEGMYPSGWCSTNDGVKRIVRFADFDGDGRDDMICDTQLGDHEVRISHSTVTWGRWSYSEQDVLDNWCFDASEMFWPDLNGDGHADAVCFVRTQGLPYIKMNDGRGGWLPEEGYPSGWCSTNDGVDRRVSFADLNGDGLDDMICDSQEGRHFARISLPTQTGSGVWMYQDMPLALDIWCFDVTQMYWTDLNGDGHADAVCYNSYSGFPKIRMNDGRGGWLREQVYRNGWCFSYDGVNRFIRFADMNGDGLDDMICDTQEVWHYLRISLR